MTWRKFTAGDNVKHFQAILLCIYGLQHIAHEKRRNEERLISNGVGLINEKQ